MDEEGGEKFTRCIICSNHTIQNQCFNIFNTTLDKGKILLADFVKNVLNCSVLIVVSPEFFICKRCFSLCTELDFLLARCNEVQLKIQTLFKNTNENNRALNNEEERTVIKTEILDEDEVLRDSAQEEFDGAVQLSKKRGTIEDIQAFLEPEVILNDFTIIEANPLVKEPSCHDDTVEKSTEVIEDGNPDEVAGTWRCRGCSQRFTSLELLEDHKITSRCIDKPQTLAIKTTFEFKNFTIKMKRKKKVYFCNRCSYETAHSGSMEKHILTHKTDASFMCDVCGRRFKYWKTFTQHQQVHDESRPFPCKLCPYRSETDIGLKNHIRLHDDQKKYACTKCKYQTLKKMSYLVHLRKHTGERPYVCPNCPYRAKDHSTMLRHHRTHTGLKRYHCSICDYKALQKGALTIHMMTHTGEKPHACTECDYRSIAKHNLDAHIAAKHCNEKPFACSLCSYRTKVKRLLTYHMRSHSDEKPFVCEICNHRVRYRGALRYHMKTKHPPDGQGQPQNNRILTACQVKRFQFPGDVEFSDDGRTDSDDDIVANVFQEVEIQS